MKALFLNTRILTSLFLLAMSGAVTAQQTEAKLLLSQYQQFAIHTQPIDRNLALSIASHEKSRRLDIKVYGIVDQPFSKVSAVLSDPAVMCDFLILNLNIKTCTYAQDKQRTELVIYVAGKNYSPLYRAMEINPYFELQKKNNQYMRVLMASRKSRWALYDYSVIVEATALGNATLLRFTSKYHASHINMAATLAYLKTFARNKVGFTVVGHNELGEPKYIQGMRGVIERNAVRSYLALQAYLETSNTPEKKRFDSRLRRWFKLTDAYPRQLHEMELQSYLDNKHREYRNQYKTQQKILRRDSVSPSQN